MWEPQVLMVHAAFHGLIQANGVSMPLIQFMAVGNTIGLT